MPSPSAAATPKPTQSPEAGPSATPKYEPPENTAEPVNNVDFTVQGAFHNESPDGADIVGNADGSLTITFKRQYAAVNFYLPDNAQIYYSNYKCVVLSYTSEGGNLGHALYDADMQGESKPNAGKHADWSQKIVEAPAGKLLKFGVTNQCAGNCIRGLQIFNPNTLEEGQTITITVKSVIFSDKENPSDEELPLPTKVPEPTPAPTLEPTPEPVPQVTRAPGIYEISGPVVSGGSIIWDTVTFGSYYQSVYEPAGAPSSPEEGVEYTDSDGTKMIYMAGKYYKSEPVKWRVLSVNGYDALIIADMNIDSMPFSESCGSMLSWESSSIRRWLNDEFYTTAFDGAEQSTIRAESVRAGSNPQYGTDGGGDTIDYIYLLSLEDMINADYGFAAEYGNNSETRRAVNTDYAVARGAWTSNVSGYAGNGWWWLRSAGSFAFDAAYAGSEGYADCSGFITVNAGGGIRPAMHIDLRSASWSVAEPVSIEAASDLTQAPAPTESPVKEVDLSAVHFDTASCGYYDDGDEAVHVNDVQTANDATTYFYLPIPVTVAPGEKLNVTVSGTSWGTGDLRIWTTPQGREDSGDYVVKNNIFLSPAVNADGSFSGTVCLTAQNADCNRITLKAAWGVKVKNLVITDIKVEHIKDVSSS